MQLLNVFATRRIHSQSRSQCHSWHPALQVFLALALFASAGATASFSALNDTRALCDPTLTDPSQAPFPNAVCYDITKPSSGNRTIIFLNNYYVPDDASTYPSPPASNTSTKWRPGHGIPRSDCDTSQAVYSGKTHNPYAPDADDCLAVQQWTASHPGHWIVSQADMNKQSWTALAIVGSCALVVGAREEYRLDWGLALGNEDLSTMLWEAISKYQSGGKVEALGNARCLSWTNYDRSWTKVPTDWRLVHPDMVDIHG